MSLNDLAREIHDVAVGKGFYSHIMIPTCGEDMVENPSIAAEKLMLIVSEVSETLEALRDRDFHEETVEVADIMIRVMDYAAFRGIDLDAAIEAKMEKNRQRPHMYGRAF